MTATGPAALWDALSVPSALPHELRITIDGLEWVFLLDSLRREQRFGQLSTSITGRSVTALLSRPYARERDWLVETTSTAQQVAELALQYSGVSLDWRITDWLLPAYSHSGTPLSAVQRIVEGAGGYVQSHRQQSSLLAMHPYPDLPGGVPGGPWGWGGAFAADVELAPDAIIVMGIDRGCAGIHAHRAPDHRPRAAHIRLKKR